MNNKDLIAQYVDTGLKIPEYQFKQLPNWGKKTYLRKRLIATKDGRVRDDYEQKLVDYELGLLDKDTLSKYLNNRVDFGFHMKGFEFNRLSDKMKIDIATTRAEKGNHINDEMFKILPDDAKQKFINLRIARKNPMSPYILKYAGEEVTNTYIKNTVKKEFSGFKSLQQGHGVSRDDYPYWFEILPDDLRVKALEEVLKLAIESGDAYNYLKYVQIEDKYYKRLGPNKKVWLNVRLKDGYISELNFYDLTDEQKREFVEREYINTDDWRPSHIRDYISKYINR